MVRGWCDHVRSLYGVDAIWYQAGVIPYITLSLRIEWVYSHPPIQMVGQGHYRKMVEKQVFPHLMDLGLSL